MKITRRCVASVEDATAKLDAIARRWGIESPRYVESEADSMTEFDALKWISLCSQRNALKMREKVNCTRSFSPLQKIYMCASGSVAKELKNSEEGFLDLAA